MRYNEMKHNEMRLEAMEDIKETLKWYSGYYCDLHNEVFNTDYYIIGTYNAEECLEKYGVFAAIEKVREYEEFNFGEVYTDVANPEKLVNMLYYIIGEEVINEIELLKEVWDDVASDEINAKIIEEINEW